MKYLMPNEMGLEGILLWRKLPGKQDEKEKNILEPLYEFLQKQGPCFRLAQSGEGIGDGDVGAEGRLLGFKSHLR